MKKLFTGLLSVILLGIISSVFYSCDTWMKDDDFYSDIERDVKIANAEPISVFVRYAMTKQGKTNPEGYSTFKVGIPQGISATTETEYGFVKWAAFSTSFLSTGNQNKDKLFVDESDYNSRIRPYELSSSVVSFDNPRSANTEVTVNESRSDIFIVPVVTERPKVNLTIPARGSNDVVRNMSVRISFTKPMDPSSFLEEDAVSITEGSITIIDGEMEIESKDISNLFEDPILSRNGKMLTLKFTPAGLHEGYDSKSTVNITISKEVKDIYGFSMVDDETISFTAGSGMDSYAPRITQLTAGRGLEFGQFQGMYDSALVMQNLDNTKTKFKLTTGSNDAAASLSSTFYNSNNGIYQALVKNRVSDKVTIRVYAEDLTGNNNDHLENDVAMVAIRSKPLFNDAGTAVSSYDDNTLSMAYIPQGDIAEIGRPLNKTYSRLVQDEKNRLTALGDDSFDDNTSGVGCLFVYDMSSINVPDGLIQIDVAAIDNISNSGFTEYTDITEVNGNGWGTIFVVKDTTPPAALSSGQVSFTRTDNSDPMDLDDFYNAVEYEKLKISVSGSAIVDSGNALLRSNKVYWIVKEIDDTVTSENVAEEFESAADTDWKEALPANVFQNFTAPTQDNPEGQRFAYALKDDMGNIFADILPERIKFDCNAPVVGTLEWEAADGSAAGVTTGNILNNQTLIIPVTEETSGIEKLELSVRHVNASGTEEEAYGTPFAGNFSISVVKTSGTTENLTSSDYSIDTANTKILKFTNPATDWQAIQINGIQIADSATEGNYKIRVTVKDAALNETTSAQPIELSNDSTAPVINKIIVPDINKGVFAYSNTETYWADYSKLDVSSTTPKTTIYVTFNESNSGANLFDFTDSTISFTNDTKVYKAKVNAAGNGFEPDGDELARTISGKVLKLTSYNDIMSIKGSSVTLIFTDVQLSRITSSTSTKTGIKLVISDRATNSSSQETSIKSGSNITADNLPLTFTEFSYDNATPSVSFTRLADRGTDTNSVTADTGFTNETYVDADFSLLETYSGVTALTLDGAVFDETTSIQAYIDGWITIVAAGDIPSTTSTVSFNNKVIVGSNIAVNICNIKLLQESGALPSVTVEDGEKTVKVTATSLGGITSSVGTSSTKTINYDKVVPQWNGNGLYTTTQSTTYLTIYPEKIWPHPKAYNVDASQRAYGLKNEVEGNTAEELYFYVSSTSSTTYAAAIRLEADVTESNRNTNSLYIQKISGYTNESIGTDASNSGPFAYHGITPEINSNCKFKTYVVDKAGNKSEEITFNIIVDRTMQNDSDDLNDYIVLDPPTGFDESANMHKNPLRTTHNQNAQSGYEYTLVSGYINYPISNYEYVLKSFDDPYKIRIKLGNGTGSYGKAIETTSSAAIEYYSVTHLYDYFSSYNNAAILAQNYEHREFIPTAPGSSCNNRAVWHKYETGEYDTDDIVSSVDQNGDIIITLPNTTDENKTVSCPPLALWLKDGCGNEGYVLIRPDLSDILGSSIEDYDHVGWIIDGEVQDSSEVLSYSGVTRKEFDNVLYYKGSPVLTLYNSDSSIFNNTDTGYTLRTKLISWSGTSAPTKTDFDTDSGAWTSIKATSISLMEMHLNLPTPSPNTSETELWYIMEDTVGNYKITKLTDGTAAKWMYDTEAPIPVVDTSVNINTIATDGPLDGEGNPTGVNYYSSISTVTYSITDAGSGIYYDGDETYSESNRSQQITKTSYDISSRSPDSNMKITIPNIADFVGNTASVGFTKDNVSNWIKQTTPELDLSTSNLSNTQLTSKIIAGDHNEGWDNWNDWGITRSYIASDKTYRITATKYRHKMYVKLNAKWKENDSTQYKSSDSNDLLGWIVRTTPLSDTASNSADKFKNFYPSSLVGSEITEITDNKYLFEKTSDSDWSDVSPITYFYPVNKAGLICKTPIIVIFEQNVEPTIKTGTLSYPNVGSYVNGNEKINFLKSNSQFVFTTNDNTLSKCDIMIGGQNSNTKYTYTDSASGLSKNGYQYTLDLSKLGTNISDKELWLKMYTATESTTYRIFGPAGANKWTYDAAAPDFAFAVTPVSKVGSSGELWQNTTSNVYYFSSDSVLVSFDYSDEDILKYEAKIEKEGDTTTPEFADITSSFDTTNKTYTLTNLEEGKLYTITFRATDKAQNEKELTAVMLKKDKTAPTGTVSASYTKASSGTPVENTHYSIVNGTEDGAEKQTIYYRNSGTDRLTAITISISSPSDSGSGLDSVYYTVDGGAETALSGTYSLPVTLSEGLEATYKIYVKDKLNNSKLLKTIVVNGKNPLGTVSFTQVTGTKLTADTAEGTDSIYYNSTSIAEIQLAISSVQDSRGNTPASAENAVKIFYQKGSSTPVDITGTLKLPCPIGDTNNTATYTVYAEDSLGNKKILRKYVLNGKLPAGAVTYSAEEGTAVDGTDSSIIYFKSTGSAPVTSINLTSTVKDAEDNAATLYYQIGDGELTAMTGTALPCPGSAVSYEATYKIYGKDTVGNISAVLATFTLKGAAPTGSIDSYVLKKNSTQAVEATDTAPGDYIATVTESNGVISAVSFIYNPAKVNLITINPGTITDCGSGSSIVMTIDGNYEMNGSNIKTYSTSSAFDIELGANWTTKKVYRIFVRDAAGNETRLIKYEFKAHGSAPVVDKENDKIGYTGLAQVPTYPGSYNAGDKSNWIKSFANNDSDYSVSPTPVELKSGKISIIKYNDGVPESNPSNVTDYVIRQADANTKFTLPVKKSSLPSTKLYYGITYGSIKESDVEWNGPVDVSSGKLTNVTLDMNKFTKLYTFVFVWYKDEIGNICVHNLVFYSTEGYAQNWWTKADYAGDVNTGDSYVSPDISIERRMRGGAFGSAWNTLVGSAGTTVSTISSAAVTYTELVTSSVYNAVKDISAPVASLVKSTPSALAGVNISEIIAGINKTEASSVTETPAAAMAVENTASANAVPSAANKKPAKSARSSRNGVSEVQAPVAAQVQSTAAVQITVENEAQAEAMDFAGTVTKVIAAVICALLLSIGGFILFRRRRVNINEEK